MRRFICQDMRRLLYPSIFTLQRHTVPERKREALHLPMPKYDLEIEVGMPMQKHEYT
jgi:hypothetical protein